jgi:hypothetical protein
LPPESRNFAAYEFRKDLAKNHEATPNMQSPEPKKIKVPARKNPESFVFILLPNVDYAALRLIDQICFA